MKIGIIGAGMTGLTAAYALAKKGIEVTLFESDDQVGGIAGSISLDGVSIEKYYHHFFKSDTHIVSLIKELGLEKEIMWLPSKMGFYADGQLFDFGTPVSLLKFRPLSFLDKFRFGMAVLKIMGTKEWRSLETQTAYAWIRANAGEKVLQKVWQPLLTTKFGTQYKEIAMSWFWGKIKLRGASKENGREVLGYLNGSSQILLDRLQSEILKHNGSIHLNCEVKAMMQEANKGFILKTDKGDFSFDKVICTTPLPAFLSLGEDLLPKDYIEDKKNISYTAVCCTILTLNRPFMPYYWLNIGDDKIPFGGLIEHTNLLEKEMYHDKHILYISNYLFKDSPYYQMDEPALIAEYTKHLKKINPSFESDWIEGVVTFKDEFAQPIIKTGYSKLKPDFVTPVPGLYTASMCNIYPEDRGVNYAVRDGAAVAEAVLCVP